MSPGAQAQNGQPEPAERSFGPLWLLVSCAIGLLLVLQLVFAQMPKSELDATSYGKTPQGFGAVYDLLSELHFEVSRSRVAYASLDTQQTLWLLAPNWLHKAGGEKDEDVDPDDASESAALQAWMERGGTAVVFGEVDSDWERLGLPMSVSNPGERSWGPARVHHSTGLAERTLKIARLRHFESSEDAALEPLIEVEDAPFVLRKNVGRGRLVAVADVRLVSNAELAQADHSLLALDLVRAFGAPMFDEHGHDLMAVPSFMQALRPARAALLAAGLGLLLVLSIWRLHRVPAARRPSPAGIDPGLTAFVESLALLYSRMVPRHTPQIARAYRDGIRHRLQRVAPRAIVARQSAGAARAGDGPDPFEDVAPRNLSQLERVVRDMERRFATLAGAQPTARSRRRRRSARPLPQEP